MIAYLLTCAICQRRSPNEGEAGWSEACDGSGRVCCASCFEVMVAQLATFIVQPRCETCGSTAFQGCDCDENRRAITRGEVRKEGRES